MAILTPRPSAKVGKESFDAILEILRGMALFLCLLILCSTLSSFAAWHDPNMLVFFFSAIVLVLSSLGLIGTLNVMMQRHLADRDLVERKMAAPMYDVELRLSATAATPEKAQMRMREIASAYQQYSLGTGNGLRVEEADFDPRHLMGLRRDRFALFDQALLRLNLNELAGLWHLPGGEAATQLERNLVRRTGPPPDAESVEGVLIGHTPDADRLLPVHLAPSALARHILLVAKTQKGKSNLMAHLALSAMEHGQTVVVIDPHGDLASGLRSSIPLQRLPDVVDIDLSDTQQLVGFNPLQIETGVNPDLIVSQIVHVGQQIWEDFWGPRMEMALRVALLTLLVANRELEARGEEPFTLIDIPALLSLPRFRLSLLETLVRDDDLKNWWLGYFEQLRESLQADVVNPVLSKMQRFSTHTQLRRIFGQSRSTIDLHTLLYASPIWLVNTASGSLGVDAAGLLSAVLIDALHYLMRQQLSKAPAQRHRVLVIVDEFQSIPGLDFGMLLGELQKMGVSFVLATQSLSQLDKRDRDLRPAILSNVDTLCVFQTSAEDADVLGHELDDAVESADIINLPDYACYLKTQSQHRRLPVRYVETLAPRTASDTSIESLRQLRSRYTRSIAAIDLARKAFEARWYGRSLLRLKQVVIVTRADQERDPIRLDPSPRSGRLVETPPPKRRSERHGTDPKGAIRRPDPPPLYQDPSSPSSPSEDHKPDVGEKDR